MHGSNGYVDKYVQENCQYSNGLFDNLDAYYLQVNDGTIVVLGKDSDAAFYGLTTLYMVVGQLDSRTIKNFTIEDYANVASRGFIEGYYGNPWSTQDRVNLMTWGGYYKLNSYFYAPKDDPKHNSKWRELYSDEEIENKIKPLAEVW
ncbi:beta-N-acetylglucosaminidase domain-containing protein [Coprobacillaceae bacterium CR2/5/TPMF4]|nr:beta-N-acetylglucosaminidase domain-containing protein [Coprobacillaceae bacterium CR2/5/TPMF4]